MAQSQFSIWKRALFRKVKEIKDLRGGVALYAAQAHPQIDAEIEEKGRFRTSLFLEHKNQELNPRNEDKAIQNNQYECFCFLIHFLAACQTLRAEAPQPGGRERWGSFYYFHAVEKKCVSAPPATASLPCSPTYRIHQDN
ncbi:MAG: hypothetical protein ACSLFH_09850 [Desulfuromonadales bacterium]